MADLMDPAERHMARHALGLVNGRKTSYRNAYVAYPNSPCGRTWLDMVDRGLAVKGTPLTGGMHSFALTRAGAEAALDPGETLDPEDFPNG